MSHENIDGLPPPAAVWLPASGEHRQPAGRCIVCREEAFSDHNTRPPPDAQMAFPKSRHHIADPEGGPGGWRGSGHVDRHEVLPERRGYTALIGWRETTTT